MDCADSYQAISTTIINLDGSFTVPDGRIGTVASTPELAELNSFLGVLKGSLEASNAFEDAFHKVAKKFRKRRGSFLAVSTDTDGKTIKHSFRLGVSRPLSYEEADALLEKEGWSLDCWHPLEISSLEDPTSRATGQAAKLLLEWVQQTL